MRSFIIGVVLCVSATPFVSHAAVNAGAVTGIWFSTDTFVEKTPVDIFMAIQNGSSETIEGTVQFFVDGNAVGTSTFSTLPAKIERVSLPYTFTTGVHSVSGRVSSANGDISLVYEQLPVRPITVTALPPPPAPVSDSGDEGSGSGAGALGSITAAVAQAGNGVMTIVNPITESIAQTLESARDTIAGRTNNSGFTKNALATSATTTQKSSKNLFDVSSEIAQESNLPLWRRGLAILLGIGAWLVRYWLWGIVFILAVIVWRMMRKNRDY